MFDAEPTPQPLTDAREVIANCRAHSQTEIVDAANLVGLMSTNEEEVRWAKALVLVADRYERRTPTSSATPWFFLAALIALVIAVASAM